LKKIYELNQNFWIGYSQPLEHSESTFSGRDPMRFSYISDRLAESLVPGISNQNHRSGYFKLMALAKNDEIHDGLAQYSDDFVEQVLLLERAWTIGLFLTEDLGSGKKNQRIYGVNKARRLVDDFDNWSYNPLLKKDCILGNQRGTGGYGYYHVAFDSLNLDQDDFIDAVIEKKKNRGDFASALCVDWKSTNNIKKDNLYDAMIKLVNWIPLNGCHENSDIILKNRLLQNQKRNLVYQLCKSKITNNGDELKALIRLSENNQTKQLAQTIIKWDTFIKKILDIFQYICKCILKGEKPRRHVSCVHEADAAFDALQSMNIISDKQDIVFNFLLSSKSLKDYDLIRSIVLYHHEAQTAKEGKPWIEWDKDKDCPLLILKKDRLEDWISPLRTSNSLIHQYRIHTLCSLVNNTGDEND